MASAKAPCLSELALDGTCRIDAPLGIFLLPTKMHPSLVLPHDFKFENA